MNGPHMADADAAADADRTARRPHAGGRTAAVSSPARIPWLLLR